MKKFKRMAIKMFRLFLEIAVRKFSQIFDFGWQIINWAASSMTLIFMQTCIFRQSEISLLYYFLFCYCKFTGKHQCQSIFLIQPSNFVKKESLAQLFSCEFCKISKNTFFTEHLYVTASRTYYQLEGRSQFFTLMQFR